MKHQKMRLKVAIQSRQNPGYVHPPGAEGIVVEPIGPNAWLVEVRVPDDSLEGDAWYETLELHDHELDTNEPTAGVKPSERQRDASVTCSLQVAYFPVRAHATIRGFLAAEAKAATLDAAQAVCEASCQRFRTEGHCRPHHYYPLCPAAPLWEQLEKLP